MFGLTERQIRKLQIDYLKEFIDCMADEKKLSQCYACAFTTGFGATQGEDVIERVDVIKFCEENFNQDGKSKDGPDKEILRFDYFFTDSKDLSNSTDPPTEIIVDKRDEALSDRDRFLLNILHMSIFDDCTKQFHTMMEGEIDQIEQEKDPRQKDEKFRPFANRWNPETEDNQTNSELVKIRKRIKDLGINYSSLEDIQYMLGPIAQDYIKYFVIDPLYDTLSVPKQEKKPLFYIAEGKLKLNQNIFNAQNLLNNLRFYEKGDEEEEALEKENQKLAPIQQEAAIAKAGLSFSAAVGLGILAGVLLSALVPGIGLFAVIAGGGVAALGLSGVGLYALFKKHTAAGATLTTLGGAGLGAAVGATLGSVFPGIGTAVGAVIGAAVGAAFSASILELVLTKGKARDHLNTHPVQDEKTLATSGELNTGSKPTSRLGVTPTETKPFLLDRYFLPTSNPNNTLPSNLSNQSPPQ